MTASDPADIPHVLAPPPLIYLLPLLVTLAIGSWRPWPVLPSPWPYVVGPALVAAGALLLKSAIDVFRSAKTNPQPWKPTTALVITGPYRFTRNPIYLSFTCTYLGITFWANSLWPLPALLVVLTVMQRYVIQREERYLERKFGEPYRAYMTRVRRWI